MSHPNLKGGTRLLLAAAVVCAGLSVPSHAQTRYDLASDQCTFTYSMTHPMHDWSGASHAVTGQVVVADDGRSANIEITAPVLSFDSGNGNRDSHMAEAVESYIFANATFKGQATRLDSSTAMPDGRTCPVWQVTGTMNFHGVARPLSCPVQLDIASAQLSAHGQFALKLTDFEIELPALLGIKVKDELDMVFDVVGRSSARSS